MSQAELLAYVIAIFGEEGIDHMLVGSHASSLYGEARSTHDIDLVIDLPKSKIASLVSRFDSNRYYVSATAFHEGRMANIIDTVSGDKVDCFMLSMDPIDRKAFSRRKIRQVLGIEVATASAEDTVLSKLRWSQMIDGSQRQLQDVREILRVQRDKIDFDYLHEAAREMGLTNDLNEMIDAST